MAGTFWVDGGPRVAGVLALRPDSYSLDLEQFCVTPQHLDVQSGCVTVSGDPGLIAADHAPRTILAELEGQPAITLLNAHMDTALNFLSPAAQRFAGSLYVVGAHIAGNEHLIHGIRWSWNVSSNHAGWLNDSPTVVNDSLLRGTLGPWFHGIQAGLQFNLAEPRALNVIRQGVMSAVTQFAVLWSGRAIDVDHVEIQLEDENWYEFSPPQAETERFSRSNLLPLNELSLQSLARWLPMASKLDPLPYIASASAGVLQIDAQAVSSALEGLHRRLHEDRRPFAELSRAEVKRAMKATREDGVNDLLQRGFADEALARKLLSEALNHIDQPSYQQRVEELAAPVELIAPGLCGPDLADWAEAMKNIRNDQSHQLLDRFYEEEVTQYFIASISGRWVLTLRILLEFVDPVRLHSALREAQTFAFALANMDAEHYWKDFSCLGTFRDAG